MPPWAVVARVTWRFESLDELRVAHATQLGRGRAFVPGATGLQVLEDCQLVIEVVGHPSLSLGARVVMPEEQQATMGGVGLSLAPGQGALVESLLTAPQPDPDEPRPDGAEEPDETDPDETDPGQTDPGQTGAPRPSRPVSPDVVDSPVTRLSRLTMAEKIKLIRKSQQLSERNLLERMLGKSGWEALLSNPRLTIPEVAKLARKGTMPRPLVERIVDNKAWVAAAPVRRALLANPKLPRKAIADVLRAAPRRELEQVAKGAAYPPAVREVIRRMLRAKP